MTLIFNHIENGKIFADEFNSLNSNNEIKFSGTQNQITVVYGPNGTGKSSLTKVLDDGLNTKLSFNFEGKEFNAAKEIFHVINDQTNRNIIHGKARDFFLGDNVREEFELEDKVHETYNDVIQEVLNFLKHDFGINSSSSPLISLIQNKDVADLVKDCANPKSKGKKYITSDVVAVLEQVDTNSIDEYDVDKLSFLKSDLVSKSSIINQLTGIVKEGISSNVRVREIEENTAAIDILSKFNTNKCIVCDNKNFNRDALIERKRSNKEAALNSMNDSLKQAIELTMELITEKDPFGIKQTLLSSIENGTTEKIIILLEEIDKYKICFSNLLINRFAEIKSKKALIDNFSKHKSIICSRPPIFTSDIEYIKEVLDKSMGKSLNIERDHNNNIHICLSDQELLETSLEELPLSTGEQNFLSLTFEFLKAKQSSCPIVVIDDPISSFDSIFKNKVAYAILKILADKKCLILTHNTDLIRLLEAQYKNCFNLYILHNTYGEQNGFIPLNKEEKDMLISLEKLLSTVRNKLTKSVTNYELFLISMIPFMRGYANIIGNSDIYEQLSKVMHGYSTKKVDIAKAYNELFGDQSTISVDFPKSYTISVDDILKTDIYNLVLFNKNALPLLNRTLKHSFSYLYLRLLVEKKLVEKFKLKVKQRTQLGQIISQAFPNEDDPEQYKNRIRLTSKKTLINEFNHFEGNLSIFQPAIDITDKTLKSERDDIIDFVSKL